MVGYGIKQPVGHVDFYPNGGKNQPGCSLLDFPVSLDESVNDPDKTADTVGRHLVACSHSRAIELYIESLDTYKPGSCVNVGYECSSYDEFSLVNTLLNRKYIELHFCTLTKNILRQPIPEDS